MVINESIMYAILEILEKLWFRKLKSEKKRPVCDEKSLFDIYNLTTVGREKLKSRNSIGSGKDFMRACFGSPRALVT